MIEKLKYQLSKMISFKQLRISCLSVITAATIAAVTLIGYSLYTVNIFDGEKTYTVLTLNNNVTSVLSGMNLKSKNYSIKNKSVRGRTTSLEISYTFPVYITIGDKTTSINFTSGTVEDALKLAGFEIDEHDIVQPKADTVITETTYIDYSDIDYVAGSYQETIPYETEVVYSSDTAKGVVKTLRAGANGVKEISYTEKFVNGVSVEKNIVSTNVVSNAVSAKNLVGTKVSTSSTKTSADVKSISVLSPSKEIALDSNGNPVNYKSKLTLRATAYTYTGYNCSTGVAPKPGYIAVNPAFIPYGTKMYIKSPNGSIIYGYAVAADTGGFIKNHPTGIDLFLSSESACVSFGVRNMEVYILE